MYEIKMLSTVKEFCFVSDDGVARWRVQALRAKVAEGGRVVSSETMERMIDAAVNCITKTCYDSTEDVDDSIREHIGTVTQEFIDKVIQQIFAEMNVDDRQ